LGNGKERQERGKGERHHQQAKHFLKIIPDHRHSLS
jgi:hypothetical protein